MRGFEMLANKVAAGCMHVKFPGLEPRRGQRFLTEETRSPIGAGSLLKTDFIAGLLNGRAKVVGQNPRLRSDSG